MKNIFLLTLLVAAAFAAAPEEPSAFGAGNLDSPNPYGLSEEEKHIFANKRAIESLQRSLLKQQQITQENRERIDGLQSILEGLNNKIRSYDNALKQIEDLNQTVDQLAVTQQENFEQIRAVLQELGAMIDSINEKYVDKERFNKLESTFLEFKTAYDAFIKKSDLSGKSNARIYADAKKFFSKKNYSEAKVYFNHLIKNHYKPATSNYYLGEIAYREGRFNDAIAYYKKSASLYDKSSFMPTLLLHTAISFERIGDKKQAKEFYESLVQLYPDSKSASIAKKNLAKLK
ncbi:tetratricopeptide repeat protein [Hydrogenimonas sp.]|uniref:tetratricopeptide repeat protein n=1 Tax=Hydrogenimonas sp. TaxID=2231112 RepID=UPI002632AAAD|nr:tetratricopeptide repeat protein [Hydrogenimonas sp.]